MQIPTEKFKRIIMKKLPIEILLKFQVIVKLPLNLYFPILIQLYKYIQIIQKSCLMNRPLALVCYICGRQFGTKSLGIHIKACQKKWETQESMKPPKQRRPCPRAPPGLQQLLALPNITRKQIQAFNNGSFNTFKQQALMQCQYCGRKFNPKSLVPHQKACKTNPMIRKPYVSKGQQQKQQQEQPISRIPSKGYSVPSDMGPSQNMNLVPCRKCGRKFASDRVGKHQKVCKGPQVKTNPGISEKYEIKEATKPKMGLGGKKGPEPIPKWKAQSNQLQQAMKEMRKLKAYQQKGGNLADLPPPTRGNYDHYVECKYCGRKYAAQVAQRHIPKCANIINKPGGIKPSKIQQKYIGNTGAGSSKIVQKTGSLNSQPVQSIGGSKQISSNYNQPSYNQPSYNQPSPVKLATKPQMLSKNVKR